MMNPSFPLSLVHSEEVKAPAKLTVSKKKQKQTGKEGPGVVVY